LKAFSSGLRQKMPLQPTLVLTTLAPASRRQFSSAFDKVEDAWRYLRGVGSNPLQLGERE
jgi:hypothetical protein